MVGQNWEAVIESACRNARQFRAQKEELVEERHVEALTSEGSAETRKAEADNLAGVERAHKKHRASTTVRILARRSTRCASVRGASGFMCRPTLPSFS